MKKEIKHNGSTTGAYLVDENGKLTAQPNDGKVSWVIQKLFVIIGDIFKRK
jgi:hypothetical protein